MQLFVSTTGTQDPVILEDLGYRELDHPLTDYNLTSEYTYGELVNSQDFIDAVDNGYLTVKDENGNVLNIGDLSSENILNIEKNDVKIVQNPNILNFEGNLVSVVDEGDGKATVNLDGQSTGILKWTLSPSYNGIIDLLGWNLLVDSSVVVDNATPLTASCPAYHSHWVLNVTNTSGMPFELVITGTTIDESTGNYTFGDTEIISIIGNGYYQSSKSFIDASEFTVPLGKSCTFDLYRTTYWDNANTDFSVKSYRIEFTPDASGWEIYLTVMRVHNDGSIEIMSDVELSSTDVTTRAEFGGPGKDKRIYDANVIYGSQNQGVLIQIHTKSIGNFSLYMGYQDA